ncbi:hypothetical protein NPS53_09350 [Pseudomonas putida]|uniref:hypothetical protein n=1 Tax=Pseudomonas putida TaxID=303 RepID=UPI00236400C5|nr:hypothetical protein [Pseudomonas putida]MDD2139782.1 hypothetical protein [Pseudomonas putida]HDS1721706.1 hypothetical protein [Pseudomonas putida]
MSLKKGKAAIKDLLAQMKTAPSVGELDKLAHTAHACVTFAEMDDKMSRISKSEGNKISDQIDKVRVERLKELAAV